MRAREKPRHPSPILAAGGKANKSNGLTLKHEPSRVLPSGKLKPNHRFFQCCGFRACDWCINVTVMLSLYWRRELSGADWHLINVGAPDLQHSGQACPCAPVCFSANGSGTMRVSFALSADLFTSQNMVHVAALLFLLGFLSHGQFILRGPGCSPTLPAMILKYPPKAKMFRRENRPRRVGEGPNDGRLLPSCFTSLRETGEGKASANRRDLSSGKPGMRSI